MFRSTAIAATLALGVVLPAAAQTTGTANQAQTTTGSGQNVAGSVTQPGTAQVTNSGQNQNGNYGTGIAGARADTNPKPSAK